MARIKIKSSLTISDAFDNFILAKSMQGVSDVTLQTYQGHFHSISKHLDTLRTLHRFSSIWGMH